MSVFTVSIVGDKQKWPIMLANGNIEEQGQFEDGRHWVRWHDPHPKPSYFIRLSRRPIYIANRILSPRNQEEMSN